MIGLSKTPTLRMPSVSSYGQYQGNNYGIHALCIDFGPVTVWFSYQTVIAFQVMGHTRVVHENDYSVTTGKHLRWIDGGDKRNRVSDERFQELWDEQVSPYFRDEDAVVVPYKDDEEVTVGAIPPLKRKLLPFPVLKLKN